jgi:putative PIN family toxin of toxin-antitoxin system
MIAVFDTNILVAAFVSEGVCSKLLRRGRNRQFSLVTCPFILQEVQQILTWKFKATRKEIQEALQLIRQAALIMVQPPWEIPDVCRDPDDNQILACASAAKADYLVTGDDDLLVLKEFKNIPIIKPRDFEILFED